jgi:hypothetical protein
MIYKDKAGSVILPKGNGPWVLDGFEQPTVIKHVYVTPDGYFPRMRDIATIFGRSKREVEYKRMKRTNPKFDGWYKITNPTVEDVERALVEVNRLYRWFHNLEDNCSFCNEVDDLLNKEKCWLVSTTHDCESPGQEYHEINITYSYKGTDYTVTFEEWQCGVRLHLKKEGTTK